MIITLGDALKKLLRETKQKIQERRNNGNTTIS